MFNRQVLVILLFLLFIVPPTASAQTATEAPRQTHPTQVRGYWIDPSTGLMWAGKDNGKDVNWGEAKKYCRNLRLGGYYDWRLATIEELEGIYDKNVDAPGLGGKHTDDPLNFRVKGYLFLTGDPWSSSQIPNERGRPSSNVWYFDFINGNKNHNDVCWFGGDENYSMRALCVRPSGQ